MLKLKRMELQGFKSFCDRTDLRFHGEGIAAIVGPNGCGKSNLADAIAWVLGEQSAKSLRGGSMQDVIFSGARDRKPVGLAQVTLTLIDPGADPAPRPAIAPAANAYKNGHASGNATGSNGHSGHVTDSHGHEANRRLTEAEDAEEWAEDPEPPYSRPAAALKPREISVSRRLYRSGESEYRINGKIARLRDIQDVFMGTGLGPESYAIIEQGRIGQILSSRPHDRRAIIEEAAGVTRFKTKRKLAEAKLESAKQNLTRVFDILSEVERQMNSLKRQAAKAKRYVELREEYQGLLRTVLATRYQTIEREAARIALELNQASRSYEELHQRVTARETEYKRLSEERCEKEVALTQARRRLADLRVEEERARGRLSSQQGQIVSIEQRIEQTAHDAAEAEQRSAQSQSELEVQSEHLARLEEEFLESQARLNAKNAERERVQASLREKERGMETARLQVLRLMGELSQIHNQLAQVSSYLESIDRDKARSLQERENAERELGQLREGQDQMAEKVAARKRDLQEIVAGRGQIEHELNERRTLVREIRQSIEQLRNEFSGLQARQQSLQEILSHHAYTTQTVKKLFTAVERGQGPGFKPRGVLADYLDLEPGHEKAVEEFLHEELEYVVVESWEDAWKGIGFVRNDGNGRATFCLTDASAPAAPAETAIEGAVRLADVLKATGGLPRESLEWIEKIAHCYLVDHRETAERLAARHPHLWFLLPDGVAYHGPSVSGGKKSGSGPLALKRELRDLNAKVASREQALTEQRQRADALDQEVQRLSEELERLRSQQQIAEKEALTLEHEARRLDTDRQRVESRLNVARLDLKRLEQEVERSTQKRAENERAAETKEQARVEQEHLQQAARTELESLSGEAGRLGEEHSALRVEMAGIEERRRAGIAVRNRLDAQVRELDARRQQLTTDRGRLQSDRDRLAQSNQDLTQRVEAYACEMATADQDSTELAGVEEQMRAALSEIEQQLAVERSGIQEALERKSATEVALVRAQSELHILDDTSQKELAIPVKDLASEEELAADEAVLQETSEKCDQLRKKIEALGPVNPDALSEFDEVQDRFQFLTVQRQDLLDSIRDTEKAIAEIDTESRKKFQAAFEAINANFRETFKVLFGGGIAEMRLTDELNIAESGIEIVGSPPGKRLQNILLLSGGEKALTAMALLMAIFQYKPSPFCVLDEVDAPLDEPNILRFTRLLKEMSIETQFVLITHAKRTMEAAEILYGVTMQEPGVSSVVSVRFDPVGAANRPELAMAGVGR